MALSADPNRETVGIAAKVANTALVVGGVGAVLLVLGVVLDDEDLREYGIAGLVYALGGGFVGYRSRTPITAPRHADRYAEPRDTHRRG